MAISSVVYAVGRIKDFEPFFVILLSITPSNTAETSPNFKDKRS